jgi:uncharacterized protein (DUF1778 family)
MTVAPAKKMIPVRPDTKAQLDRHRKAANIKRWSLNRFYLEAADKLAAETLATQQSSEQLTLATQQSSEQLTVKSDPLALNQ